MSVRLQGKVAVITGGTSGIGAATAELFVAEGAKVVLTGRSVEKGNALAERLGSNALYHESDVMREADIKASIDLALDRFGKFDVLFNNAGGQTPGRSRASPRRRSTTGSISCCAASCWVCATRSNQ